MNKLRRKSSLLLALAAVGGSLVFAAGEKPARPTHPENAPLPPLVEPERDMISESTLSALGPATGPTTRPTLAEIDSLRSFLEQYAPHHFRVLQQLGQLAPESRFWTTEVPRYQAYLATKQALPELANIRLERLHLEDELLSTVMNIRVDSLNADTYRPHIHRMVQELEDNKIKEQRWRVDQLQSMLDDSQKKLDTEMNDRDRLVENRVNRIMYHAKNRPATNRSEGR